MAALRILVGDMDQDRYSLIEAAKRGYLDEWRVPKSAKCGDDAIIYLPTEGFVLTAHITKDAVPVPYRKRKYQAPLDEIERIRPPISIDDIKKSIPEWRYPYYPKTYTTPSPAIAEQIRGLIRGAGGYAHLNEDIATDIEAIWKDRRLRNETTRKAMIDARLGQGRFRADLMERWDGACAVTRCGLRDVLKASHIKPWSISNNRERLDPANGLLLAANIDALFGSGLVTFDNNGRMRVSNLVSATERKRLGLPRSLVRAPNRREKQYLAEHRRSKFRGS